MSIEISPSILAADFANLEAELQQISTADWVHVDVMDAHFVPNLTIGLPVVERLAEVSPLPLDVHLMIEDPDHWAPLYAQAGAKSVTFHLEAARAPVRLARELRALDVDASVALRPATPASAITALLDEFDQVLVMTVEPGFGGQSFITSTLGKVRELAAEISRRGLSTKIQVDGGVDETTIAEIARAGAQVFVAGTAVYGKEDRAGAIAALRAAAVGQIEA